MNSAWENEADGFCFVLYLWHDTHMDKKNQKKKSMPEAAQSWCPLSQNRDTCNKTYTPEYINKYQDKKGLVKLYCVPSDSVRCSLWPKQRLKHYLHILLFLLSFPKEAQQFSVNELTLLIHIFDTRHSFTVQLKTENNSLCACSIKEWTSQHMSDWSNDDLFITQTREIICAGHDNV